MHVYTLRRKYRLCIPFLGIARPLSQFPQTSVCERFIYIPRIGPHISCSRIGRSIVGIYKSLTDTWMWKLGLRQRNSFFWEFLVLIFGIVSLQFMHGNVFANWYLRSVWTTYKFLIIMSSRGIRKPVATNDSINIFGESRITLISVLLRHIRDLPTVYLHSFVSSKGWVEV